MIQSRSAGHAKAYFSDALSKSDYYTSDQELPGYWQGKLAGRLGIDGLTSKESFFALCENRHPLTGDPLTPRTKAERTTGYDINFHCPKSVSVLHVFAEDGHLLTAFRQSVTDTMQAIERDAKTRIRKGGVYDDRQTGELIWAHFTHQTARPVEGFTPDPHLHSHCFVFNGTWDEQEKRIKAGQFKDIKRDMPYYQAMFHKNLSDRLIALGYQVRRTDKSFEVVGVPDKVTGLFSKRTDEIGRIAKEKGITDAKELDGLGARTRAKKQKGNSMAELKDAWRKQIETLPKETGEGGQAVRYAKTSAKEITPKECVQHATEHCFERASVMDDRRLLESAYCHGIGSAASTVDEITAAFKADDRFIYVKEKSRFLCTTKQVLAEEKRMVELARAGQGAMPPLYDKPPKLALTGQQADAVTHILTTPHRVSIIRGAAGTGKTTLMKEAVSQINKAGKEVIVVAPTAQASRGVLRGEGFSTAETVASFLVSKAMQEKVKGQVLWVDEAGLLGTKDMTALLEVATRQNARLILGGDTRQHASVVRGDALRIINTVAGIKTAEVSKIYRQKNEHYKSAVEDLSKGNVAAAFEKLDDMNFIREIDASNPTKQLVADYIGAIQKGKSALIISPTHAQGDAVTDEVRRHLRTEGLIGKKELAAVRYVSLNMTEAEKADARNFEAGQVVQFTQNVPGFQRGSLWQVQEVNAHKKSVQLLNDKAETKQLPLHKSLNYDVFRAQELSLSKGDRIRITKNGFDVDKKRLNNGDMLEVVSVSKSGKIILRNDLSQATYTLDQKFGHIAHAHCVTSHASQGKTVDEVFIWQPAATFPATDAKQFYVSVSRGKERAHIYTDNKQELLEAAQDLGERQSAIEAVRKDTKHIDAVLNRQRTEKEQSPQKEKLPFPKPIKSRDHEPER